MNIDLHDKRKPEATYFVSLAANQIKEEMNPLVSPHILQGYLNAQFRQQQQQKTKNKNRSWSLRVFILASQQSIVRENYNLEEDYINNKLSSLSVISVTCRVRACARAHGLHFACVYVCVRMSGLGATESCELPSGC